MTSLFFTCLNFETHTFKIHKKIHRGDEPFDCSTCTFSQSGVLTSQSKIYIERKPSTSPKCGIIFTLRVDFGKHMKETHTQAKQIITSATNVTGLSLHVGTFRHILLLFTRRFTHELSLLTVPFKIFIF